MLIHNLVATGSLSYNGVNISYVTGSQTSLDGLNQFSASVNETTGSLNTATGSLFTASGSFSTRVTNIEGNYATTGSNVFLGAQTVCANITSTGTIIAQTLNVQQVTSSIVYSSGSNIFGCSTSDVQQMTGSLRVTGSGNHWIVGGSVGINTTSPDPFGRGDALNVGISATGASDNMALSLNAGASGGRGSQIYMGQGGTRHFTLSSNSSETTIGTVTNTPFRINTCDTTRLYVSSSTGNIGINTTTPTNGKLEIQQTDTTAGLWVQTGGTTTSHVIADFRTGTNLSALQILGNGASTFSGNITTVGQLFIASGSAINIGYRLAGTAAGQTQWLLGASGTGGVTGAGNFAVRNELTGVNPLTICAAGQAVFVCSVTTAGLNSTTTANGSLSGYIRNTVTAASAVTGYGLAIESEASAATSYALTVRNLAQTTTYFHISTETGKVGNVGIGTTDPTIPNGKGLIIYASDYPRLQFKNSTTGDGSLDGAGFFMTGNSFYISNRESGEMVFENGANTERMRIKCDGVLVVGDNSITNTGKIEYTPGVGSYNGSMAMRHSTSNVDGSGYINFYRDNTVIGSINQSGTTAVTYNTTSDYRLKQDFKDFNGLGLISSIKIYDYQWKSDNSRMHGVIAHELQEVLPYAVTGIKDGELMQGVDYSKLTPILVKAIQEQQCKINILESCLGIN